MNYQELNRGFVQAIQDGELNEFIKRLNFILNAGRFNYLVWLFVARAYEAQGDVDNAFNSYAHLLRLARFDHPNTDSLLRETRDFALRHDRLDLIAVAEQRFGPSAPEDLQSESQLIRKSEDQKRTHPIGDRLVVGSPPLQETRQVNDTLYKPDPVKGAEGAVVSRSRTSIGEAASSAVVSAVVPTRTEKRNNELGHLFERAKRALHDGDLALALQLFEGVYELGSRSSSLLVFMAQVLQRLGRLGEAQAYLDEGLLAATGEQRLSMLTFKAQIFSSEHQWDEAIDAYERLIKEDHRPAARRFARLQVVRIYERLSRIDEAMVHVNELLKANSGDLVALRLRTALDQPRSPSEEDIEVGDTSDGANLIIEFPTEPGSSFDLVSPLLQHDVDTAEFRDEKILRQAGSPDLEDAKRLLVQAEATIGSEFGERYPMFLEAAKAFLRLPEGSYDLQPYYRALVRYAMAKGGALVAEMRRRIFSGQGTLDELSRLRDSAMSYSLESLELQIRFDPSFALIPLTNLLRAQVACALRAINTPLSDDLFQTSFSHLLRLCHNHPDDGIARAAYDSVVALGAAGSYVWNRLAVVKGGTSVLGQLLETPKQRHRAYQLLSQISSIPFDVKENPGQVLKEAFVRRQGMTQEVFRFFSSLQQIPLSIQTLRDLHEKCQQLPYRSILLDTDREVLEAVIAVTGILLPYQLRSQEERTSILFSARTNVENMLALIDRNPTYWGRVGFEPLLKRWQAAIRTIEHQRLRDIQPQLEIRLDPPVFHQSGNVIEGGILIENTGSGTADGVRIAVSLYGTTSDQKLAELPEETIGEEIPVGSSREYGLRFPNESLAQGLRAPYVLLISTTTIFRQAPLDKEEHKFTLEVSQGSSFTVEDIPWNELEIPPKQLFKGREHFIEQLAKHLRQSERNRSFILFGLTRTGKSSILTYLGETINLQPLTIKGKAFRFLPIEWNFMTADAQSNAQDMWAYLLGKSIVSKVQLMAMDAELSQADVPELKHASNARFRDWEPILTHLEERRLYPVFLIDEFSYFGNLVRRERIDAAFLAAIRQFAIGGKASFVFAGTYDVRDLIRDPAYGITGQLVNTIERQVSSIDRDPAIELIQAMGDRLTFTPDAVDYLLLLSFRIPYFIQLLCRYCALYAIQAHGRSILGFPEVDTVVRVLARDIDKEQAKLGIDPLPSGVFMNNMQTPTDPDEFAALIATICHLNQDRLRPRMVTYSEIASTWDRHKVRDFPSRLASAISELKEREILIEGEDEGIPAYRISVDLFRRWASNEYRNLNLILDALQ